MTVEPVKPFGAVVKGASLTGGLQALTVKALEAALAEHHVLVLRGQPPPTDEELVAFMSRFGPLEVYGGVQNYSRPGFPEVIVISNILDDDGQPLGTGFAEQRLDWHSDYCWRDRVSKMACLEAVEVPSSGGETWFVNMCDLYDSLEPELRDRLADLECVHTADPSYYDQMGGAETSERTATHPMVAMVPGSGRRAVYANHFYTKRVVGLSEDESRTLLDGLFEKALEPQRIYEHKWRPGDLVLGDEIAAAHGRNAFDSSERRYLRQITVIVDDPDEPWRPLD